MGRRIRRTVLRSSLWTVGEYPFFFTYVKDVHAAYVTLHGARALLSFFLFSSSTCLIWLEWLFLFTGLLHLLPSHLERAMGRWDGQVMVIIKRHEYAMNP